MRAQITQVRIWKCFWVENSLISIINLCNLKIWMTKTDGSSFPYWWLCSQGHLTQILGVNLGDDSTFLPFPHASNSPLSHLDFDIVFNSWLKATENPRTCFASLLKKSGHPWVDMTSAWHTATVYFRFQNTPIHLRRRFENLFHKPRILTMLVRPQRLLTNKRHECGRGLNTPSMVL